MATYEDIKKANELIKPMFIERYDKKKGQTVSKEYAEVPQRTIAFRSVHPNGSIETEVLDLKDGKVVMKATIKDENGKVLATGTAFEDQSASQINGTSYIENCETSAVGRALGFCGFGIGSSIASYEEVKQAMAQQEQKKEYDPELDDGEPATPRQLEVLKKLPPNVQANIINHFGLDSLDEISKAQAIETISKMRKK